MEVYDNVTQLVINDEAIVLAIATDDDIVDVLEIVTNYEQKEGVLLDVCATKIASITKVIVEDVVEINEP